MRALRDGGISAGGLATLLLCAALASCGGDDGPEGGPYPSASGILPYTTLTDWVSYAEQVSVVTVDSESAIPPPAEVLARGEGYVGRDIVVRIEETLWLAEGGQAVAGELSFRDWGWLLRGDRWTAFDPRMEVGQRYIAPLVRVNGEWITMALLAIPVEDARVASDLPVEYTFAEGLAGATLEELRAALA